MPVNVEWLIPDKIILVKTTGNMNLEVMRVGGEIIHEMLDASSANRVHVMGDETEVTGVEANALKITRTVTWLRHSRLGYTVSFGSINPLMKVVTNVGSSIAGMRYRRVDSMDEALMFLAEADPELPPVDDIRQRLLQTMT
ncbi:MAG: hypothetical protein AAF787_07830 [Chloroflexota bacterium]